MISEWEHDHPHNGGYRMLDLAVPERVVSVRRRIAAVAGGNAAPEIRKPSRSGATQGSRGGPPTNAEVVGVVESTAARATVTASSG